MRPGRTQTGLNSHRCEIFATVYRETGTKCFVPDFGNKMTFLSNKYIADPKAYRLEISGPGLRFVVINVRTVRTQTGTRISLLGPATETMSDRSEFIVRPVSCKRIKRIVWRLIRTHAGLNSSWSRVNTPLDTTFSLRFL